MFYNISIIIPFFNASKLLNESIRNSKKIVKRNSIQIIYINNNSSDISHYKLLNKLKNEKDIVLLKTKKSLGMGPGIARNLGIKFAKGKNILFLDVDDKLVLKKIDKLIKFSKNNKSNLIYLGRNLIKNKSFKNEKTSPFLKYYKKNLYKFFKESNNMCVIFVLFKKNFIKENKLLFDKGFHEDIFFLFKSHYYNKERISYFSDIIYLKTSNKNSIIHSNLTMNHIEGMFKAWKNINLFLKKNLSTKEYKSLYPYIQYRWRGELANEYNKIINCGLKKNKINIFLIYVIAKYKKYIFSNFKAQTNKDKIVKNLINS